MSEIPQQDTENIELLPSKVLEESNDLDLIKKFEDEIEGLKKTISHYSDTIAKNNAERERIMKESIIRNNIHKLLINHIDSNPSFIDGNDENLNNELNLIKRSMANCEASEKSTPQINMDVINTANQKIVDHLKAQLFLKEKMLELYKQDKGLNV